MAKETNGYTFESNGKWYARITFTDESGKRRNIKRTALSKKEASVVLKELNKKLETEGKNIFDKEKLTFNDLANYYESNFAIPAKIINNQKVEGLRSLGGIKNYLVLYRAFFGNKRLVEITHGDLSRFRAIRLQSSTIRKKERTVTSVNRELACLRRIFNISLRQGWIDKNPFICGESLILISCERRRERILTVDEEIKLLEACDHPRRQHLRPILIGLLDTGARKAEMLKLVWRDVNFDARLVTFQALNTKTLKTRQVGITQRFFTELQNLWRNSDKGLDSLVFGVKDNVKRSFSTACKIAGIEKGGIDGLTLHSLRHTAATRLVRGNLPLQMIGRILGHAQPSTTYRYLTADSETLTDAVSILESYQIENKKNLQNSNGLLSQ